MGRWPRLDFAADRTVIETWHAYLQVIGKLPTRGLPWCNHGWHVALRVTPRGLRTYALIAGEDEAEVLFDCISEAVELQTSAGFSGSIPVQGQTVAEFHAALSDLLERGNVAIPVGGAPNEIEPAIPFAEDDRPRAWDGETVRRCHAAFRSADRAFARFRTGFVGKSSPPHLFWGSFDLAVTRFSGREAPLHPGGVPNLPDAVTREAYSHEVASAGFWLGGNGVEKAAFYAYGYPTPTGLSEARVAPAAAYWHGELGEFVLPYAAVREAADPDATLDAFLDSTFAAVAERGGWNRAALEIPPGSFGVPHDVARRRSGPAAAREAV